MRSDVNRFGPRNSNRRGHNIVLPRQSKFPVRIIAKLAQRPWRVLDTCAASHFLFIERNLSVGNRGHAQEDNGHKRRVPSCVFEFVTKCPATGIPLTLKIDVVQRDYVFSHVGEVSKTVFFYNQISSSIIDTINRLSYYDLYKRPSTSKYTIYNKIHK